MKTTRYFALALIVGSAACSAPSRNAQFSPAEFEAIAVAEGYTAETGLRDARAAILEGHLEIMRFDRPLGFTSNESEYRAPFEELGIKPKSTAFQSKRYCNAFNAVMDKELEARFGTRYTRMRQKILPQPNADYWYKQFPETRVERTRCSMPHLPSVQFQ